MHVCLTVCTSIQELMEVRFPGTGITVVSPPVSDENQS